MHKKLQGKRILSLLLSILLLLSVCPFSASAYEGVTFELLSGTSGFDGEGPENLIDGDKTTKWYLTFEESATVIFKASEAIKVSGYQITTGNDTDECPERNPKDWTLSGCNDYTEETGGTWTVLDTVTDDDVLQAASTTTYSYAFHMTDTAYQYFKLEVTEVARRSDPYSILQIGEFTLTDCAHTLVDAGDPVAATCTVGGYTPLTCTTCSAVGRNYTSAALGHDWGESKYVSETCEAYGYTEKVCQRVECGYKDITTDWNAAPTGHNYVEGICTVCDGYHAAELVDGVYQIGNAGELMWFAALVNGELEGVEQNASANAVLINDITINEGNVSGCGGVKQDGWRDWTPIAYGNTRQYSGSFDGCGYTVSGLYYKSTTMNYVGLFGKVQNGTVSNVSVENSYFHGYKYVGGVCGSIVNSVSGAELTISSCFNTSTVEAEVEAAGGVVGYVNNTSAGSNATITFFNCRNTGSVALTGSSTSYHAGGVIGYVNNTGTNATVTVTNCYNEGSITAAGSSSKRIGGVCGRVDKAIISDCYNLGTVTANGSRSQDVGGVCGYVYKAGAAVENCYSFGSVSAPSANNKNTGGVVGYVSGGTVEHCYYLDSAAAKGIGSGSGSTESKTEEQFASGEVAYLLEEYAGNSTWGQVIGVQDYPTLSDAKVYLVNGSYSNHNATAFEGKPATCTETGRKAYWYCPECDKYFVNAECTVETTLEALIIAALGHSYGYTNNGDGTHTVTCSACGDTFTEDHTFANGACICGAVESTAPILDGAISIGQQLFLESNLTMSFRIKKSQLNSYDISTAYLVIEQDIYPSDGAMYVKTETLTDYTVENDRLVFQYHGIAAAQMNDNIRATLHIKDSSGKEYMSSTLTTSVTAYAKLLLDAYGTTNAKLCTVLMDMLNYGTAAQLYFDRHADAPANAAYALFADFAGYASDEFASPLEDLSSVITNAGATATMSLSVELSTSIGITYKVTLPSDVNMADAVVVVKDADGNELETLSLANATVDTKGCYVVTYFGTPSRLMRRVVYGTVYVGDTAISNTYGYSISTYAYQTANTADIPEALVNLTNLMVMYGDAASAYFGG